MQEKLVFINALELSIGNAPYFSNNQTYIDEAYIKKTTFHRTFYPASFGFINAMSQEERLDYVLEYLNTIQKNINQILVIIREK